jgi:hypothetical protein
VTLLIENLVDLPVRPGAGGEVEFYAVLVLVAPDIEQKRLELHGSTLAGEVTLPLIQEAAAGMMFSARIPLNFIVPSERGTTSLVEGRTDLDHQK